MTGMEPMAAAALAAEVTSGAAGLGSAMAPFAAAAAPAAAGLGATGLASAGAAAGGMGGGTASLFGAGASPLATGLMAAPEATAPVGMGGGTASLFGPAASGASPLATSLADVAPAASGFSFGPKQAMQGAQMMNKLGGQQQQPMPAQRPPSMQSPVQSSAEIMQRLKMMQGGRSDFAGLLGQAIGRG